MADVELGQLRDGGDRADIVEGEAVAGVGLDAVLDGERGAIGDALQLRGALLAVDMGVAAGVELDDRRAEPDRRVDLRSDGSMNRLTRMPASPRRST